MSFKAKLDLGRNGRRVTGFVLLGRIFDAFDVMLLSMLITHIGYRMAIEFNYYLSKSVKGLILGAALLASGIGGIIFGFVADRIGRKKALFRSVLIYSIFTGAIYFVKFAADYNRGPHAAIAMLLTFRFIMGLGVGGERASGMVLVSETVLPERRGTAIGIAQTGRPIGFFTAIARVRFLGKVETYPANYNSALAKAAEGLTQVQVIMNRYDLFAYATIPGILVAIGILLLVPESPIRLSRGAYKEPIRKQLEVLKNSRVIKLLLIAIIIDVITMFSYRFFRVRLPEALADMGVKIKKITSRLFVTQIGALLGYLTYGYIQDHIGRKPARVIFTFSEAIMVIITTHLLSVYKSQLAAGIAPKPIIVAGFLVGYFTGYRSGFGAFLSELFPTKIRSTAAGLSFNIGRSVSFIVPPLGGYLHETLGRPLVRVISLASIAAFTSGIIMYALIPETRGADLTKVDEGREKEGSE